MTTEDALVQLKPMNEAMAALGMDAERLFNNWFDCEYVFGRSLVTILPRSAYYRRHRRGSAGVCMNSFRSVELIADLPPLLLRTFLAHEAIHLVQDPSIHRTSGPRVGRYASRSQIGSVCEVEAKLFEVMAAMSERPGITPAEYRSVKTSSRPRKPRKRATDDYLTLLETIFPHAERMLECADLDRANYGNFGDEPFRCSRKVVHDIWKDLEPRWWPKGNTPPWFGWDPWLLDEIDNPQVDVGTLVWWSVCPIDADEIQWRHAVDVREPFSGFDIQQPMRDVTHNIHMLAPADHTWLWHMDDHTGGPAQGLLRAMRMDHDPNISWCGKKHKPPHRHLALMWLHNIGDVYADYYDIAVYDLEEGP